MILKEPPPARVLNLTKAKSGSTPVVSQSMTRPMVPVGAITVAWALRKPCSVPSASARSQARLACSTRLAKFPPPPLAGPRGEPHRRRRELLVAGLLAMGGAAMVADHPQHRLAILLVA